MQVGDWQLETVSGGAFLLDGGSMFGVVPKPLWERLQPPDAMNRIRSATNCVLARDGTRNVLIDTGYGGKATPREQERFALEPGEPLVASLAALGLAPADIDIVVFSHLHFDHAGGAVTKGADGSLVPTFPRAQHIAQRGEWEAAIGGAPELKGSYLLENLLPLEASGRLTLIDGDVEILPGLRSIVTGGHTAAHQALVFSGGNAGAIYIGDLCPMSSHLPSLWCMAFDIFPLETRRKKPQILEQAADAGWTVIWNHDPDIACGKVARHDRKEFVVVEGRPKL